MAFSLASLIENRPWGGPGHRLLRDRISVAAGLIFLLFSAAAAAKAFEVADAGWEGTSEFYALAQEGLGKARVEVVATIDYEHLTKDDGLIVLHPDAELDYNELSAFLRAGGRMAVLDDRGEAAHFLARFQIHRVEAPAHPAQSLRDNPNLAIAIPAVEQVAGQEQNRHPVVAGVERVVTNHPTALVHPNLTQVLKIPALGEPDATLAVTGIIAKSGRLFAMGDPSVVINEMLRYPGNRAFANGFSQKGHFGGSRGALGELSGLSETLANFIAEIAKNGLPGSLAIGLAVLACAGVLVWAISFSSRLYRRSMPRYAVPSPLVAQGGLAGRAAALAAPSTDPVLLMLELRAALSDALCHRLGIVRLSSPEQIVAELSRNRVFSAERVAEVSSLFREFAVAQASLLSRKRLKMARDRLAQLSRKVLEILSEIEERSPR